MTEKGTTENSKDGLAMRLLMVLAILIVINLLGYRVYERFDLTSEKRFSLSDQSEELVSSLDDIIYIKVYLDGDLEPVFKKLKGSVKDLLSELKSAGGSNIEFEFIDPSDNANQATTNQVYQELLNKGLEPKDVQVRKSDGLDRQTLWPGAIISYKDDEIPVNFLAGQSIGANYQATVNEAEETLEYSFINAIRKISIQQPPRIAFTFGNGELDTLQLFDLFTSLQEHYEVDFYSLASIEKVPSYYDALLIAKPTRAFSEWDKFKLDNFVMRGGNVLWLLDATNADMDSMQTKLAFLSTPLDLNLDDQLFKYGFRLNYNLIQDRQCSSIPVTVSGEIELFPWFYFPLISGGGHPISKSIDPVRMQFASTLDTIPSEGVKKEIILRTSEYTRVLPTPVRVNLSLIRGVGSPDQFKQANMTVGLMLSGKFPSLYKNRGLNKFAKKAVDSLGMKMYENADFESRMIVVADGDIARNEVSTTSGNILPLGLDKYTRRFYGNKTFLMNAIDYLCNDEGLIQLRAKEIKLRLLDPEKVKEQKTMWQTVNILLPVLLMILFGLTYNFVRRRSYGTT